MTRRTFPTLPDDCVYDVFQFLSATGNERLVAHPRTGGLSLKAARPVAKQFVGIPWIPFVDLARVSSTCHAWRRLSQQNSLWQRLCLERWRTWPPPPPSSVFYPTSTVTDNQQDDLLNRMLDRTSLSPRRTVSPSEYLFDMRAPNLWYSTSFAPFEMGSWKDVYRERHQKDALIRMLLEEMVEDSRNRIRHMDGIASIGMVNARDVLENIIAGRNGEQRDLTRIYYSRKMLKRLRRGWVLDQWRAYRLNQQSFPIWQGCGLMAMFSDHELELSDLDRQFQDMADEFLSKSPLHHQDTGQGSSAFSSLPSLGHHERRRSAPTEDMDTKHYEDQTERLRHLIRFFTQEKGFKGNTDNYYDPFNSFIDKVLTRKLGIPITLCIVFAELAQRVGITGVELIGFPQHFMVRYRPSVPTFNRRSGTLAQEAEASNLNAPQTPPTYYLDLFHPSCRLLTTEEYQDHFSRLSIPRPPDTYRDLPTPPLEIFLRCLRNIIVAVEQSGTAGRYACPCLHVHGFASNHMSLTPSMPYHRQNWV